MNQPISRWYKIFKLSQAHLAPNMSLLRWQSLLEPYQPGRTMDTLTDAQLDELILQISIIVKGEQNAPK